MTLEDALKQAEEAIELYETHESPFADDRATTAHCLKRALEDLRDAVPQAYLEGKSDRRWEEKQGTFAPNPYGRDEDHGVPGGVTYTND